MLTFISLWNQFLPLVLLRFFKNRGNTFCYILPYQCWIMIFLSVRDFKNSEKEVARFEVLWQGGGGEGCRWRQITNTFWYSGRKRHLPWVIHDFSYSPVYAFACIIHYDAEAQNVDSILCFLKFYLKEY